MATKLGIAATTVQGWKKRGVIPKSRVSEIIKVAEQNKIHLGTTDETVATVPPQTEAKTRPQPQAESVASVSPSAQDVRTELAERLEKKQASSAPHPTIEYVPVFAFHCRAEGITQGSDFLAAD